MIFLALLLLNTDFLYLMYLLNEIMNPVVLSILAICVSLALIQIIYFIPFFDKKKIKNGKFNLTQFLYSLVIPAFAIPGMYVIKKAITSNPKKEVITINPGMLEILFLTMVYFSAVGNGIHSLSVILAKNMNGLTKHKAWDINEFFHHKFSHLLLSVPLLIIFLIFAIFEINHPGIKLTHFEVLIITISSIVSGVVLGLFAIEGSIPKEMLLVSSFSGIFVTLLLMKYNLNVTEFPFTMFVLSTISSSIVTTVSYRYLRSSYDEIIDHTFLEDN